MSCFLRSTRYRSSRFRLRTSAPNMGAPELPFSTPPSNRAPTVSTARFGSSSATINSMLADYFEDAGGIPKGELRQNQFGVSIGGPIIKNKIFFFGDYEGLRRVQGTISTGSVPTRCRTSSGYTNFSDLITGQYRCFRHIDRCAGSDVCLYGTILDPATTRTVTAGDVDPVSGLTATAQASSVIPSAPARPSTAAFTLAGCGLNQIASRRLDPNAIELMQSVSQPRPIPHFSTNSPIRQNWMNTAMPLTPEWISISREEPGVLPLQLRRRPAVHSRNFRRRGGRRRVSSRATRRQMRNRAPWPGPMSFLQVWSTLPASGFNYLHTTRSSPEARRSERYSWQIWHPGYSPGA